MKKVLWTVLLICTYGGAQVLGDRIFEIGLNRRRNGETWLNVD